MNLDEVLSAVKVIGKSTRIVQSDGNVRGQLYHVHFVEQHTSLQLILVDKKVL